MTSDNKYATPPACILRLIELSEAAWNGDKYAKNQLRFAGELIDFVGGAEALCNVQGMAHDHLLQHRRNGRDLAGHMAAYWEHIPSWAAL